jgi:uncharacterized protein
MLGKLTEGQIEHVLQSQMIGRIACYAESKLYIVPITYVYHDKNIYAHSREGRKIDMMRKNRDVCFEVDVIDNMANWRSVVAWGQFEELSKEPEKSKAMKILSDKVMPVLSSETLKQSPDDVHPPEVVEKTPKTIAFRIRIRENTGRFEKK